LALASIERIALRLYHAQVAAGNRKAGLDDLRGWVAKYPNSPHARTQLATALLDVGDIEGAKKEFEVVAQAAPKDPVLMTNLAWAYFKAGDPRALTLAEDALRLRPGDPAISNTLGWILLQQGEVARATELLARAAKGLPNEPGVRYRYASGLAKSGNRERARVELSSALSLDKPFPEREQAVALLRELNR
jgi:Flp pilus assembly protein TadD